MGLGLALLPLVACATPAAPTPPSQEPSVLLAPDEEAAVEGAVFTFSPTRVPFSSVGVRSWHDTSGVEHTGLTALADLPSGTKTLAEGTHFTVDGATWVVTQIVAGKPGRVHFRPVAAPAE